jgi:hypothetical protein
MATPSVCKVEGCDKPARSRGWCNMHHLRWRKHGDPTGGRTLNGEPERYMLAHMWDDCPKWPFYRHPDGYGEITYRGRRGRRVHRIVCEITNGPPPSPDHEAAHNCGNGHLGCFGAACLEWKTRVENIRDAQRHGTWVHGETHPFAKLTEADVREIRRLKRARRRWGYTVEIADRYGVDGNTIRDIWAGRTWAWLTDERASA